MFSYYLAVKQELVIVEYVEGSVDYIRWKTKKGKSKSTNCLDNILQLTKNRNAKFNKYMQKMRMIFMFGDGPDFVLVKAAVKDYVVESANV
ncbi:2696_t:CDS:2 [Scutellospora calospora]|uniref:2696_t:CDS:1 n=1 Tax=Scutellospora calospora TaxID=85575 RepID=A0ACA9K9L6_9GLOM|nr:2696_t:CDS:2 [Scutellospora calospora]